MTHAERKERRGQMAEDIRSGGRPIALAAKYSVTPETVRIAARTHGVSIAEIRRQQYCNMVEDFKAGCTIDEVARKYSISYWTVRRILHDHGVSVPCKQRIPGIPAISSFFILKLLLGGKKQIRIAEELDVSRQRIHQVAEKARAAGFTLEKRGE